MLYSKHEASNVSYSHAVLEKKKHYSERRLARNQHFQAKIVYFLKAAI